MKLKLLATCVCISLLGSETALAQTMPSELPSAFAPSEVAMPTTPPVAFSTPVAQEVNDTAPAPSAGPSLFGAAGLLLVEDLTKGVADKAMCAMVVKLAQGVINNPELAINACKDAANLKYENCLAANDGEETIAVDPITGRQYHKCAATKGFDLEVCDALVDIAEAFIEACEQDNVTFFPGVDPES